MTFTRRSFISLAGATAATASLAACAGCSGAGAGASDGGDGAIEFWSNHPGGSKDLEEAMIAAWNEANPDTPATLVTAGANYEEISQKVNAALTGGRLPDVFITSDVTWFNFALNEATTPLDELWTANDVDSDDIVDTLREDYLFDGKHYGMPYCRSTCLMYFNSDVLAAAGLPTDRGPETWEEFAQWAPALVAANGGKPALVVPDGSNYLDWYFQGMAWAFGGAYSEEWTPTFSSPETVAAGQFLKEQVAAGHIAVDANADNTFSIGGASGLLQSTGSLGGLTEAAVFPFITTFLPGPSPACPTGGGGLAIPAGISEERKNNAMRFVDFITSTENTITFSQGTGYMPMRKSALEHADEVAFLTENPNAQTAIDQLAANTASQDYARVFVPGGGARIGGGLDRITIGGEEVATVFASLDKETQDVIDRDITPLLP